jgi:hypothetical protein
VAWFCASDEIVLCPTECVLARYWFRSAKTGASASREWSSWERVGVLGVHVDHKVGVRCEERHLTFCIASVGAIGVGFDEFSDSKSVGSLGR